MDTTPPPRKTLADKIEEHPWRTLLVIVAVVGIVILIAIAET
jgi:hypothetical protein